ncbi:MAG: hemerythrin domain-containing protein [Roseateles sp.]|uniref:hemerythrin domain-containing protein n=1 Tax=Roseateles sp. TaxID=1971397 RepID=UPI0040365C50
MSSRVDVLHAGPAVGFDQPFEMLAACHDRVRRSLDLLRRLHAHVEQQGVDAQARDAAADVLRYFDRAGPAHHEDEERHVLPRLRAAGLAGLADRLHAQHLEMARLWALLREPLQQWARGEPAAMPAQALLDHMQLYEAHLAAEDAQAFPAAQIGLDPATRDAMGEEMAARRRS